MKTQIHKTALLIFSLFVFLNAQPTLAQDKSDSVNLNYILSKLTFTSRISKSTEQINEELIKEIRQRKVNFILKAEDKKEIQNAGGNDLLIKAISENLQEEFEEDENSQEKSDYITLDEIKSKFISASQNQSKAEINKQLIKEIRKRKVDFILPLEDSKFLRENGGSDLLFDEIGKNTSKRVNKLIKKSQNLYQKYIDNYRGTVEQRKVAIKAGKEFIEIFAAIEAFRLQVEYLKKAVPKLEDWIKQSNN